jgi:hypothetical protein
MDVPPLADHLALSQVILGWAIAVASVVIVFAIYPGGV